MLSLPPEEDQTSYKRKIELRGCAGPETDVGGGDRPKKHNKGELSPHQRKYHRKTKSSVVIYVPLSRTRRNGERQTKKEERDGTLRNSYTGNTTVSQELSFCVTLIQATELSD
jgi:hypothetical protein